MWRKKRHTHNASCWCEERLTEEVVKRGGVVRASVGPTVGREEGPLFFFVCLAYRQCLFLAAALCWCCCVPSLCEQVTSPCCISFACSHALFRTLSSVLELLYSVVHSVLNLSCSCVFMNYSSCCLLAAQLAAFSFMYAALTATLCRQK